VPDLERIKPRDIKALREKLLEEQRGLCAICHEHVTPDEAVLDHCHKTGYIRAVLHRGCNAYIGHMENNQLRNRITPERLAHILANFETYVNTHRLILHPTFRTQEERKESAKKRARKRQQTKSKKG
jgi:hypothetical protein